MARSRPLVLDKKGRPTVEANTQKPKWKLIIKDRETGKRSQKIYKSYKKARKQANWITQYHGDKFEACVVSRSMGYGPPYSKVTDKQLLAQNENGKYWCPYCRKFRSFLWSPRMEARLCEFCHIPDTEWHVHMCNPILWERSYFKKMFYGGEM